MKWLLIIVLAGLFPSAWAEDAKNCIEVGKTERGQSFTNICPREIVVFWCHDHNQQGYRSGVCGPTQSDKRFYHYSTTLKPNQTNDNYYSLPPDSHIEFGACIGSYRDFKYTDKAGGYACSNPQAVQDFIVITTSGKTAEEACGRNKELAKEHENENTVHSCTCVQKSKVFICKAAVYAKSVPPSLLDQLQNKARNEIREQIKKACASSPCTKHKLVSMGGIHG
jgi:hypothetical protein